MKRALLWVLAPVLLAIAGLLTLEAAAPPVVGKKVPPTLHEPRELKETPPPPPPPVIPEPLAPLAVVEPVLYKELRGVINRGVDLYNGGDIGACYRLFEGSLRTIRPLLAHRPDLVKEIDAALGGVESIPLEWQKAFRLRAALDTVRKELKPKAPAKGLDKVIGK